jgi:small subunit ribosomal protein S6
MERSYESMLILNSDLDQEQAQEVTDKITDKIKDLGGKLGQKTIWAQQKKFNYPIRSRGAEKKRYNQGSYWLLDFNLDTQKLASLKKAIRLEENILRYLVVLKEDNK